MPGLDVKCRLSLDCCCCGCVGSPVDVVSLVASDRLHDVRARTHIRYTFLTSLCVYDIIDCVSIGMLVTCTTVLAALVGTAVKETVAKGTDLSRERESRFVVQVDRPDYEPTPSNDDDAQGGGFFSLNFPFLANLFVFLLSS